MPLKFKIFTSLFHIVVCCSALVVDLVDLFVYILFVYIGFLVLCELF